jgi:serine/threonine-protein kinase
MYLIDGMWILLKKITKLLILLIIIFSAIYYSFNVIMNTLIHNEKEIIIPNITGKNLYDAINELSRFELGIKKDGEDFSQVIPVGMILRQDPIAGMSVKEGKLIKIVISQGGESASVPNLVGKTLRSAIITLKYSNLVIGEILKKYSITSNKNIVISQDIAPTTVIDKNSTVNIVVSDGLPPKEIMLMPNFINKKLKDAETWALQNNIILNITKENSDEFEVDTIIKQCPSYDTDITNIKDINLCVSL